MTNFILEKDFEKGLRSFIEQKPRQLIVGLPGVGKSRIVEEIAQYQPEGFQPHFTRFPIARQFDISQDCQDPDHITVIDSQSDYVLALRRLTRGIEAVYRGDISSKAQTEISLAQSAIKDIPKLQAKTEDLVLSFENHNYINSKNPIPIIRLPGSYSPQATLFLYKAVHSKPFNTDSLPGDIEKIQASLPYRKKDISEQEAIANLENRVSVAIADHRNIGENKRVVGQKLYDLFTTVKRAHGLGQEFNDLANQWVNLSEDMDAAQATYHLLAHTYRSK
ncbi:MAG: hypothetical protein ACMXYF_03255 [Candidatus Woesearchaeota archaeon]